MDAQSPQTKPVIDLSEVLVPETMIPILADPKVQERLKPFLPSGGDGSKSTEEELRETLLSPSFRRAMVTFSSALASGRLGDTLVEFDLPEAAITAARKGDVEAFAIAMEEDAQAKKNIEAVAAEGRQEDAAEADATPEDTRKDTIPEAMTVADRGYPKKDTYAEAVAKTTPKEAKATQENAKEDGDVQARETQEGAKKDIDVAQEVSKKEDDVKAVANATTKEDANKDVEAIANTMQGDTEKKSDVEMFIVENEAKKILATEQITLSLNQPGKKLMQQLAEGLESVIDAAKAKQEASKKQDGSNVNVVVKATPADAPKEEGSDALPTPIQEDLVAPKDEGSSVDAVTLDLKKDAPKGSSDGVAKAMEDVIKKDDDCSVVKRSKQEDAQI